MFGRPLHAALFTTTLVAVALLLAPAAFAAPTCDPALSLDNVHSGGSVHGTLTCDDPSGTGLNYVIAVGHEPAHGTVLLDGAGGIDYYADADYAGPDSFRVEVDDNEGGSTSTDVDVTVVNAAPTCDPATIQAPHDQSGFASVSCSDSDGDSLSYVVTTQPAHGTADVTGGYLSYTPDPGYVGPDSFQFAAFDGVITGAPATASVTVTDAAPVCDPLTRQLRTGKPLAIAPSCFDTDGDPITYSTATPPAHGTVGAFAFDPSTSNVKAAYTPDANFTGSDSFTVQASDGAGSSVTFTVTLEVTPNHAPVCSQAPTVATGIGDATDIYLFCSDPDAQDDALTYSIVTPPSHGTLGSIGASGQVQYTPTGSTPTTDSFVFQASDGELTSQATQLIHVSDDPMCTTPAGISVRPGHSAGLDMDCTNSPGSFTSLTYQIVSQPTQGNLSPSGNSFSPSRTYTAAADADGPDSFSYRVTNGTTQSPVVVQAITTGTGANNAPVCASVGDQTAYSERTDNFFPFCSDADGDPLTYAVSQAPGHGSASVDGSKIVYTPDAGFVGWDTLSYSASDGHGGTSDEMQVVFRVKAPEAPTCTQGAVDASVRPGRTVELFLTCGSPQGDDQTYAAGTAPSEGSLDFSGGKIVYTAAAGPARTDTFTLVASNTVGDSAPQSVTVHIDANYNRDPQCFANTFSPRRVAQGVASALPLSSSCSDPDGDPIQFARASSPANGTVTAGPASTLSYTSNGGYLGADSFTYVATDDHGGTSPVTTYSLQVVQSVDPTCTVPTLLSMRPGQSRSIAMDCSDPNSAAVTYEIVTPPAHGTLSPSGSSTNATRSYTAGADAGPDSFKYRATSIYGSSVEYTQNISIDPSANRAPTCFGNGGSPAQAYAGRSRALDIDSACSDPDGDPLTFTRSGIAPSHGSTIESGGQIVYTPNEGYNGADAIGYTASDGHGGSVQQTFSVDVVNGPANTAPTCDPAAGTTPHATKVTVHLVCHDADGDFTTLSIASAPDAVAGTLGAIDQENGTVDFTPASDFAGEATFTFKASDGAADSAPATATITVQQAPPPVGDGSGGSGGSGASGGNDSQSPQSGGGSSDPASPGGSSDPPSPAGTPAPRPATADTTAPGLTLGALPKLKLSKFLKSGLPLKLAVTEQCSVSAKLTLAKTLAKKLHLAAADVAVATQTASLKAGPSTLTLKLSAKARKKLAKVRSLKLLLTVVATDAAGNKKSTAKSLSFKR